ncbi:4-hydroxybenzoate polyprenyltransferase [Catalinimonas alkaloidigena]|uniref:4-hydroxybenzoate polyprenyltransferase n=1 Tax=Catalinimonas alkaloidigena TaxID=1075417 RepID=A0A1G9MQB7_9BACT|nr:hypothetical protein [Catalinimonas alkaloidigena]SDL76486.1 4-hydroxybenzoate polyprenyltransferase [Catalinimonas alkaloidigena]
MRDTLRYIGDLLRWLSLDVVLGAVVSSYMVHRLVSVTGRWPEYVALALAVFVIYAVDRLSDVSALDKAPPTARHDFFWRYQLTWWVFCGGAVVAGLALAFFIPQEVLWFGLGMTGYVAAYLLLARRGGRNPIPWFHKEYFVAILYTAGVWGPALVQAETIPGLVYPLLLVFCLIALLNLLTFSWYEFHADERLGQPSLARSWGRERLRRLGLALSGVASLLLLLVAGEGERLLLEAAGIEGAMLALMGSVLLFPRVFLPNERYRKWGDAVFYLPALFYLF